MAADETTARELLLYSENDADLYRQSYMPWLENLRKKKDKGQYDHEQAVKAIYKYHVPRIILKYRKDFGLGQVDSETKMMLARDVVSNIEAEM